VGQLERILIRAEADGPASSLERATVVAGRGIEGDRYHAGTGTFSVEGKSGQDLTLIAAEALEAMEDETGIALTAEDAGRNLVTRGVDLDALLGKRFRIGAVECRGDRPCDPCATLAGRTDPGVLRGLARRGGLRADVTAGGELVVGAEIVVVEE